MHQLDTATSSSPSSLTWNPNPNFLLFFHHHGSRGSRHRKFLRPPRTRKWQQHFPSFLPAAMEPAPDLQPRTTISPCRKTHICFHHALEIMAIFATEARKCNSSNVSHHDASSIAAANQNNASSTNVNQQHSCISHNSRNATKSNPLQQRPPAANLAPLTQA